MSWYSKGRFFMVKQFVDGLEGFFYRSLSYVSCRQGATAIEYGLIVAGIAVGISIPVLFFGTTLKGYFNDFAAYLASVG